MQEKDNILPVGGLNTDDDPRFFEKGDYLEARNVRVGSNQEQGDLGLVQTIKSTLNTTLPDLSQTSINHIGSVVDSENDLVFILSVLSFSASDDEFVIYKQDLSTGVVKVILKQLAVTWGIVGTNKLINPVILNDNLVWTDNLNDIRMIDVNRIEVSTDAGIVGVVDKFDSGFAFSVGYNADDYVYYNEGVYKVLRNTKSAPVNPKTGPTYYEFKCFILDCYLDVSDPNNFTLAALPPLISPTAGYSSDSSRTINQLRNKTFQFSYRYIYLDWRKSTYAPPSAVPPPSKEENIDGTPNTDPSFNNFIELKINSGNEEVRVIEIITRDSSDTATWYKTGEILLYDDNGNRLYAANVDIVYYFYNDSTKEIIDLTEALTLFSYIPIKAKHQELIQGNRLSFSNITEGYGKIPININIELSWESLEASGNENVQIPMFERSFFSGGTYQWRLRIELPEVNPGESEFFISVKQTGEGTAREVIYVYNGTDSYPDTVTTALVSAIVSEWGAGMVTFASENIIEAFSEVTVLEESPYTGWDYQCFYSIDSIVGVNKYPTLSTGFNHGWGFIYRDEVGRLSPIMGVDNIKTYIPLFTEDAALSIDQIPIIDFNINHTPPEWAESYEIVYEGNQSTSYILYLSAYDLQYGKTKHDNVSDVDDPNNPNYRVDLLSLLSNTRDRFENWSVEQYQWQKGDRIRVLGKIDEAGALTELVGGIYDTEIVGIFNDTDEILGEDVTKEWLYFAKSSIIDLDPTIPASDNIYFEIYRVKKEVSTSLYFTTGMTFAIAVDVYGNKYHEGNTDQALNSSGVPISPAIVRNTAHDAWKYYRIFRNSLNAITWSLRAESQYASDWYIAQTLTSSGNPIPAIDSLQQNVMTKRIRYGGQINIGTHINNISKFDFDDFVDLKDEHGPIEGIRLIGFTLKVLQYTKVSSIFIGRQESFNAGGAADYQFTNNVFGTVRPSEENWGTAHPESVIVHNRHLFFWDQSEGIVVRDSPNGAVAISNNKMNRHFSDLARTLDQETKANQRVIFSYSKETDELFCMFGNGQTIKEIITFSERDNRWKIFIDISFNKGLFYWLGRRLFHIYDDLISEWWRGTDYQTIGSDVLEGKLILISNTNPTKEKTFDSIIVYQTGATPEFNSIDIPEKSSAVSSAMQTYIYPVNVEQKEGVYYCQILRDINDPRPLTENEKLLQGRRLRGLYSEVNMKFTGTSKITLSNIIMLSTPSERSS